MTVPTAPTLALITAEAIKKAGYTSTSSTQYSTLLARAQSDWIEEVKWDIWNRCKKLTVLQKIAIQQVSKGKIVYSMPTDYASMISVNLLDGETTGTAQAGGATSITLEATDSSTADIIGKEIVTTGGTGANQINQILAIDTTTKVATVANTWTTNPASGTTYRIIDKYYPLTEEPVWTRDRMQSITLLDRPYSWTPKGDNDNGEYLLFPIPDDTYCIQLRYHADLTRLDLDSATDATIVAVYRRYKNVLVQGTYAKCLQAMSHDNAMQELQTYSNMLQALQMREEYGQDLSNLQMRVSD